MTSDTPHARNEATDSVDRFLERMRSFLYEELKVKRKTGTVEITAAATQGGITNGNFGIKEVYRAR